MAQLTPSHRVPCLWKPTEHGCWDGVGWHQPSGNAPAEAGSYTGAAASATSNIHLHRTSQHPACCSFPWPLHVSLHQPVSHCLLSLLKSL